MLGHFEHLSVARSTLQLQYASSASYVVLCIIKRGGGGGGEGEEFYTGIMIWIYNPNFNRAIIQINWSHFFYILLIAPSISFRNESIVWRPLCIFLHAHNLLIFLVHSPLVLEGCLPYLSLYYILSSSRDHSVMIPQTTYLTHWQNNLCFNTAFIFQLLKSTDSRKKSQLKSLSKFPFRILHTRKVWQHFSCLF